MRRAGLLALTVLLVLVTSAGGRTEETKRATEPPGGMPPEDQLEATLTQWLARGDALHAAWAGWIVADQQLEALASAAAEMLARSTAKEPREKNDYYVEAALLDALVRTKSTARGETLASVARHHTESATVLLCRRRAFDPAHLAALQTVEKGTDYEAYVALGNVMAGWRTPEFTARILSTMELRRRIRIWDEDPPYPPFRGPSASVPGDWRARVPKGFPPVASYSLTFTKYERKEWSLLADGIRPVYARRFVSRGDIIGGGASGCWPELRDGYRHEWLTDFLKGTDVPELPVYENVNLKWTGGDQPWRRRTTKAIENIHDRFRDWREALYDRGLLTDEGRRTVSPKLEVEVIDNRRLKRGPLPPFPKVEFAPKLPKQARRTPKGDV